MTQRLLGWLAKVPTTNARIVVTLGCTILTCLRVVWSREWNPPPEWLVFLASMSGIDVLQFSAKRVTAAEYKAVPTQTQAHSTTTGEPQ